MDIMSISTAPLAAAAARPLLSLRGVSRTYSAAASSFAALHPLDLDLPAGAFMAVVGRSGSGKSTLLHLLGGLDRPSSGEIFFREQRLARLDEDALARWRGRNVGVVFQFFQLMPTLTIEENVLLPMDFLGERDVAAARRRARELLEQVGIADQRDKLPGTLSGGQQQRAALARALANDPPLLLADEPTGNLDTASAAGVMALLSAQVAAGRTVVMVTHERQLPPGVSLVVSLADGRRVGEDAGRVA